MLTAADDDGTYTFTYDRLGRTKTVKDVWGNSLTFSYDGVGNRTKVEDSKSGVTTSHYDAANNLEKIEFNDGSNQLRIDIEYSDRHEVTTMTRYTDLAGSTKVSTSEYGYDDVPGRITGIDHKYSNGTAFADFDYLHDAAGRLTQLTLNTNVTTYGYDERDQLESDGTNTYTYDGTGNRVGDTIGTANQVTNDGTWTYTYDKEGSITKRSKGASDETWIYEYDNKNQLTAVEKQATDGGTVLMRSDYTYDALGNRLTKQAGPGGGPLTMDEEYAYDGWKNEP